MRKFYFILLWLLVLLCGGFAVTEVLAGTGTYSGLFMVLSGLSVIAYIILLPVEMKND